MSLGFIGISRVTLPPRVPGGDKVPILAQIEIAFMASFDFDEKAVKIAAALTEKLFYPFS